MTAFRANIATLKANQQKGRKLEMTKTQDISAYKTLVEAEKMPNLDTVEIREKSSGKVGVANTCANGMVAVYYGADDGSDDAVISPEEFSRRFEITAVITGKDW